MSHTNVEHMSQSPEATGGRRPEVASGDSGAPNAGHPTSEVTTKITRRKLTVAYKIRVLETVKSLRTEEGGSSIGSYLRKEGLYYSTVRKWEQQYAAGKLSGGSSKGAGKAATELQIENRKLRRQIEAMDRKLKKSALIIDIQKKISDLLGIDQPEIDDETYEIKSPRTEKKSP